MPKHMLKPGQESFTPVEGAFAGCRFEKGQPYDEIPPNEAGRFEEIAEPTISKKTKPADKEAAE